MLKHKHQRTDSQPVIMIPRNSEKRKTVFEDQLKITKHLKYLFSSLLREAFFFRVIELIKEFLNLQTPTHFSSLSY